MSMDPARLFYQLQNTGLMGKDNPLYQLLHELIGTVVALNSGSTGPVRQTISNNIVNIIGNPFSIEDNGGGGSGEESFPIPGRDGMRGIDGLMIPGFDGLDGEDGSIIPGPRGLTGLDGPTVPYYIAPTETFTVPEFKQALFAMNIDNEGMLEVDGFLIEVDGPVTSEPVGCCNPVVLFPEESLGESDLIIPGPAGITGATGAIGLQGIQGIPGIQGEDGLDSDSGLLGIPTPPIDTQTYTPTLFNTTNVTASTASVCQYMRVGNVVTVSGKVHINPTIVSTLTQLGMSLPIASNFNDATQLGGVGANKELSGEVITIIGDDGNDRAIFEWTTLSVANRIYSFTFTYLVI